MVSEARKQSMAWMETDYSKHTHLLWKIKMAAGAFGRARIYRWEGPFSDRLLYFAKELEEMLCFELVCRDFASFRHISVFCLRARPLQEYSWKTACGFYSHEKGESIFLEDLFPFTSSPTFCLCRESFGRNKIITKVGVHCKELLTILSCATSF